MEGGFPQKEIGIGQRGSVATMGNTLNTTTPASNKQTLTIIKTYMKSSIVIQRINRQSFATQTKTLVVVVSYSVPRKSWVKIIVFLIVFTQDVLGTL